MNYSKIYTFPRSKHYQTSNGFSSKTLTKPMKQSRLALVSRLANVPISQLFHNSDYTKIKVVPE